MFSLGYFLAGEVRDSVLPPVPHTGKNSLVMRIEPHGDYTWDNNGAYQYVELNQQYIAPFTLSAWSYGVDVTGTIDSNWAILMDFW